MENLITAEECVSLFREFGVPMTKTRFSKQKSKGFYRTYQKNGSNKDYFLWNEVMEAFFYQTIPQDKQEEAAMAKYRRLQVAKKEKMLLLEEIKKQLDIIYGFEGLKAEMFNIDKLYKDAQDGLKTLDLKGKTVTNKERKFIEAEAQKTKEDHAREFDRELYAENQTAIIIRDMVEDIRDQMSQKYSDFENSGLELDLMKIIASWIPRAEDIAECYGVQLKRKEVSK